MLYFIGGFSHCPDGCDLKFFDNVLYYAGDPHPGCMRCDLKFFDNVLYSTKFFDVCEESCDLKFFDNVLYFDEIRIGA